MGNSLDLDLIDGFFREKSIKSALVFGCSNKSELFALAKILMTKHRHASVLNLNRITHQEFRRTHHSRVGIVVDGDCPNIPNFLTSSGGFRLFDVKHHWLITSSNLDFVKHFEHVDFNINSDVNVAIKNTTTQIWSIVDVYNPAFKHGGVVKSKKIGYYSEKEGYRVTVEGVKYWIRRNMTGIRFKIMAVLLEPFSGKLEDYLDSDTNRNVDSLNRFHYRLLQYCRNYYNFTIDVSSSKSWGYLTANGSFDGMIGAVERHGIDIGGAAVFFRKDRLKIVDYGRHTWSFKAGFIFRSPKSRTSIEMFFKPLSKWSWIITALFASFSVVILKMVTTFESRRGFERTETSWSLSLMFTLGAFCQQGSSFVPKLTCGRITTISIFLLSVLLYQFYSASIVSNLLMKPTDKITTVKDILDSSLKAGCEDILYTRDFFQHTADKTMQELYQKKILGKDNTTKYLSQEEGLNLVLQGGYAYHMEAARAYPIIEKIFTDEAICELREVKLLKFTDLYNVLQKGSPFRDMMETCFQRLDEVGIMYREKGHWHPRKPECTQKLFVTLQVGIEEFYPALVIFLIGLALSLVVLVLELWIQMFKFTSKKKKIILYPYLE